MRYSVQQLIELRDSTRKREAELTEQIEAAFAVETLAKALHERYGVTDFDAEAREWRVKGARLRDYGISVEDLPRLAECFQKGGQK